MTPTTPTADAAGRGAAFLTGGSLLFASKEEKELAKALDDGLERIEQGLARELSSPKTLLTLLRGICLPLVASGCARC